MTTIRERTDVEALKQAHPLAVLLAESGVRLRRSGPGKLMGRCPFHDDRRPSLLVDERDQHFHCFGCGAHGDVISFVMRRDGVGFTEACARLGARPVAEHAPGTAPAAWWERRWDRLTLEQQVVMNTAAALYQHTLWREPQALAYLHGRGIPDQVIRSCGLGYADGQSLEAFLRRRSGLRVAQDLGLLRPAMRADGGRPPREFFAGRIVVPEFRGGQCVWFIGRRLVEPAPSRRLRPRSPYLALRGERLVLGVERVVGQWEVFLCEGVFDYLTAVSWGLPAFSPCGTHLPADRLGFLARARVVYGVLDGDAAGRAAAVRFGEQLGPRWRPLELPDGCDLNDLGQRPDGRAVFFRLLAEARVAHGGEGADGNDAEG